jgi:hypothetical protein
MAFSARVLKDEPCLLKRANDAMCCAKLLIQVFSEGTLARSCAGSLLDQTRNRCEVRL